MMTFIKKCIFIFLILVSFTYTQSYEIDIPDIQGIEVEAGKSLILPTKARVKTAVAFKFGDGR